MLPGQNRCLVSVDKKLGNKQIFEKDLSIPDGLMGKLVDAKLHQNITGRQRVVSSGFNHYSWHLAF